MQAIPRALGRMSVLTFDGYNDSARHQPFAQTLYFGMDLINRVRIGNWSTSSVYINDLRLSNGTPPTTGNMIVASAINVLLNNMSAEIAQLLIEEPDGLVGRPHVVGGGWVAPGCGVVFYVARNCNSGSWCKFLCADVSKNAR